MQLGVIISDITSPPPSWGLLSVILPPQLGVIISDNYPQQHRSFRNLPPLFICLFLSFDLFYLICSFQLHSWDLVL